MAKPKRHRWVCPECGSTKLGSSRPKREATIRFCLPCSAKSPELVERTCPALDKRRADKAERTEARMKRKRETAKARKEREKAQAKVEWVAKRWVGTDQDARQYDLQAESTRLVGLLQAEGYVIKHPKLIIRRREANYTTGYSSGGRVSMTVPRLCAAHRALALLCHELAHEACPRDEWHGDAWRAAFIRIAELGYGAAVTGVHTNKQALHTALELALREALPDAEDPEDAA